MAEEKIKKIKEKIKEEVPEIIDEYAEVPEEEEEVVVETIEEKRSRERRQQRGEFTREEIISKWFGEIGAYASKYPRLFCGVQPLRFIIRPSLG